MWSSLIMGVVSGAFFALTSVTLVGYTWWEVMLIAIVPAIVGFGLSFFLKFAVKKGWLTKEDADSIAKKTNEKLDDAVDDFKDNGKIDNSNKKDKGGE